MFRAWTKTLSVSLALSVEQREVLRRRQREDLPTESDMFVVRRAKGRSGPRFNVAALSIDVGV